MIVKIKNEKNCWSYFEGDNIIQHEISLDTDARGYPDTLFFVDKVEKEKEWLGVSLCLQKEKRVVSRIITNRPTYLLNDNGKTIDKLI